MSLISSIMSDPTKFNTFLAMGKAYFTKVTKAGYISSNLGWVKKDWLDTGFKMLALGRPHVVKTSVYGVEYDHYNFPLLATSEKRIVESGSGRVREQVAEEKTTLQQAAAFFRYLDTQRELDIEMQRIVADNKKEYLSDWNNNLVVSS